MKVINYSLLVTILFVLGSCNLSGSNKMVDTEMDVIVHTATNTTTNTATSTKTKDSKQQLSIIPEPMSMKLGKGKYTLTSNLTYMLDNTLSDSSKTVFKTFISNLAKLTSTKVEQVTDIDKANFKVLSAPSLSGEEYNLDIDSKGVLIRASSPVSVFYAIQTLKQILPVQIRVDKPYKGAAISLPYLSIKDKPRFAWRGFMLDEGRHFYGKQEVEKILRLMASYKMNKFHWHLTEDQGWRIEIKKYPKLTSIGAYRSSTKLSWRKNYLPDQTRYGGYYTQQDIKDIVAYAKSLFIDIVPEIDIPGHSQAAVASYPKILSCDTTKSYNVWTSQGISHDVINVSSPKAIKFVHNVLDEVIKLFPYKYIHLGGDECPTVEWQKNADCQALLKKLNSTNYRDLQIHFYTQIQKYINSLPKSEHRNLIFWNEVLNSNNFKTLGDSIVIMCWAPAQKAAQKALSNDLHVIMTPQVPYYINRKQSKDPWPLTQGPGTETLSRVYSYDPTTGLPQDKLSYLMGVQANAWTEYIIEPSTLEYVILPRLIAVAEAAWSPENLRLYNKFLSRLKAQKDYLIEGGYDFYKKDLK